jgi:DNA-binding transcriptional ArsR family regulator
MKDQPLEQETAELIAERFRVLGDPTRLLILDHLRRYGELAVEDLAARIGASQQNASKHLGVLRVHRVVARRKQGNSSLYRVADPSVHVLCDGALGRGGEFQSCPDRLRQEGSSWVLTQLDEPSSLYLRTPNRSLRSST